MKNYKKSLILLLIVTILLGMVIACEDDAMSPAEAKAKFLKSLKTEVGKIEVAEVEVINDNIIVTFDGNESLNSVKEAANEFIVKLKKIADSGSLVVGGQTFTLVNIKAIDLAGVFVGGISGRIGDGDTVLDAFDEDISKPYTATLKNDGVEFKLNGTITFKLED